MDNLSKSNLIKIIDNSYDELLIYDNNYNIIYINNASERHYGCKPEEMIGKTFFDFFNNKWWDLSILPIVYEKKIPIAIKQTTHLNVELFTIAVPIFDSNGNIKYVVMNVRDSVKNIELYNPNYISNNIKSDIKKPICESKSMKNLLALIERVAQTDATCIFTGESGTGKTLFANYMHNISHRKDNPFISINCASIPEELFESELFGYETGAFTGAHAKGKDGLFLAAHKGTLFLDEISELSLTSQAKLLTVLQDNKFLPIGSTNYIDVDVRIIAASNRNLEEMIRLGTFREDLYYRLNLIDIYIPPLRKRKEDIPIFIEQFNEEIKKKYNLCPILSKETIEIFKNYDWKGNIRELKHSLERLALTIDKNIIYPQDLPNKFFDIKHVDSSTEYLEQGSLDEQIDNFTELIIKKSFAKHNTSRKLAKYLNISQTRANNLIRKYINNK